MDQIELYLVIACLLCLVVILARLWFTTAKVIRTQDILLRTTQPPAAPLPVDAPRPGDLVPEPLPPTPTSRTQAQERLTAYLADEFARQGRPVSRAEAEAQAQIMMDQVIW
ncbi:MAG: hypothetical protein ACK5VI_10780 [Opitutia bacterium]|jgi:hypothetical protein